MKKFLFKDGSIVTASTSEEAKAKHKVMAKIDFDSIREELITSLQDKDFYTKKSDDVIKASNGSLHFEIWIEGSNKPRFEVVAKGNDYIFNKRLIDTKKFKTVKDVVEYCFVADRLFEDMVNKILKLRDTAYKAIKVLR